MYIERTEVIAFVYPFLLLGVMNVQKIRKATSPIIKQT